VYGKAVTAVEAAATKQKAKHGLLNGDTKHFVHTHLVACAVGTTGEKKPNVAEL
jgi:hypothetical protein